jgi:hypothetical protein
MVFLMVLTFMIFWAPLQFLTVYRFYDDQIAYSKYFGDIFFVCHIIAVSRSFVNPFIYTGTNSKYREGFKYFICCMCFFKKIDFTKSNYNNHTNNTTLITINNTNNFISTNGNPKFKYKKNGLNVKYDDPELISLNK